MWYRSGTTLSEAGEVLLGLNRAVHALQRVTTRLQKYLVRQLDILPSAGSNQIVPILPRRRARRPALDGVAHPRT